MPDILGSSFNTWFNRLAPDEQSIARMIGRLTSNVGGVQREGYNRAGEMASQYDLPVGAELALNRGADVNAGKAISEGTTDILEYGDKAKRQAWSQIMGGGLQQQQVDMQEESWWSELLGGIGAGASMIGFSSLFGGGGKK